MPDPQYLTVAEAAAHFRVSTDTVRKLVRSGDLPAVRLGSTIRIPVEAVEALAVPR